MSTNTTPKIIRVKLADLAVHPVAKREHYKEPELKALGNSLRENGQLNPVLVREYDGKLELLAGTRRMRAAQAVGLETLNATVCRATDAQALEIIGVENLLRADLNPLERSRYVIELMRPIAYGGGGLNIDCVRKRFGRSTEWVRRTCKLNQVPEPWRTKLASGAISESMAQVLFPFLDKPAVLKSIERHQSRHASMWSTRDDWQRLAKIINAKFEELGHAEGWTDPAAVASMGRESKAVLATDPYVEERVDRQADKIEEAIEESGVENNLNTRKRLTMESAKALITPFADSIEDLIKLDQAICLRLEALENPSNDE